MSGSKISRHNLILYAIMLLSIAVMILRNCNPRIYALTHFSSYGLIVSFTLFILLFICCYKAGENGYGIREEKLKPVKVFWFGWFLCFLGVAAAILINPVAERYYLWMILCLIPVPGTALVFSKNSVLFRSFLDILAKSNVAGSYAFACLNYAFAPFTKRADMQPFSEYMGIASHPNGVGLLCSGFFVAAVYLLLGHNRHKWLYVVSIGLSLSLTIAAHCRTAELGLLLGTTAGIIYYLRYKKPQPDRRIIIKATVSLGLMILICIASCQVLWHIDQMDLNSDEAGKKSAALETETAAPDQNREQEQEKQSLYDRVNRLSSDRFTIWRAYIPEITPLGNGRINGPVTEANPASFSPHNNLLGVLYMSGYAAGIGFLIWTLYGLYAVLRSIVVKDVYRPQTLFFVLSFPVYFVATMLEVMIYPFTSPAALMTYLSLAAVTFASNDSDTDYRFVKRLFDIAAGIIGCLLLLPLSVCIKAAQLLTGDHGPVFYVQTRIGYKGKPFKIYKYRSMVADADEMLDELLEEEALRNQWTEKQKLDNDPRITKAGKILRKTSIDELPQFLNVLKGDMSLVGPRPLVPGELEEHDGDLMYQNVKPGMTGWWICNGHYDMEYDERLEYEYYYVENRSWRLDIICIFKTILSALRG